MKKSEITERLASLGFLQDITKEQREMLLAAVLGDKKPRKPTKLRTEEQRQASDERRAAMFKQKYQENRDEVLRKSAEKTKQRNERQKEEIKAGLVSIQEGAVFADVCAAIGCTEVQFRARFRRYGFTGVAPRLTRLTQKSK